MKKELIKTRKLIKILQVFHNSVIYKKDQKSFDSRKEETVWKNEISSTSGFLDNDQLIISKEQYNPDIHHC